MGSACCAHRAFSLDFYGAPPLSRGRVTQAEARRRLGVPGLPPPAVAVVVQTGSCLAAHIDGFGLGIDGSNGFFSPMLRSLVDDVDELARLDEYWMSFRRMRGRVKGSNRAYP